MSSCCHHVRPASRQCDENTTFSNHALYLGLPCCKEDFNSCPNIPSSLVFQRSTKETFWICTQLSSTKLTQNGTGAGSEAWLSLRTRLSVCLCFQSTSWRCSSGRRIPTGSWTFWDGYDTSAGRK